LLFLLEVKRIKEIQWAWANAERYQVASKELLCKLLALRRRDFRWRLPPAQTELVQLESGDAGDHCVEVFDEGDGGERVGADIFYWNFLNH
jgi:hypothetical protein